MMHQHRLARNLINFFIVSNVIIEITISLFAHFSFTVILHVLMDLPGTGWAVLIPILTFTPLNL